MYVEEKIGDSYQQWQPGIRIKIMASTGSGKSHFILHTLLNYAVSRGCRILYFVNRKILKEQLEAELKDRIAHKLYKSYGVGVDWHNFIWVRTYQEIEMEIKAGNNQAAIFSPNYIVYDECHYFYADSDFNTNTILSYNFLRQNSNAVHIFMSATMENMLRWIDSNGITDWSGIEVRMPEPIRNMNKIELPVDYSYIQLHCIDNEDDIPAVIEEKAELGEKWLIFIDSIEKGKKVYKELCNHAICQKNDIVFIDASYERDEEARESVGELEATRSINKKIIIATSVMDNGISFEDQELRNLLIMADSKEEFIQMLGRKRQDGKEVNVYICRRSKEYFERRKQYIDRTNCYFEHYKNQIAQMNQYTYQVAMQTGNYTGAYVFMQQKILDDIFSRDVIYKHVKKFCYFFNGMIAINPFSIDKMMNSKAFYQSMIDAMNLDPDAFVKQQAKWLEISGEKVERVILDSAEKKLDRVKEQLSKYLDNLMEDKENIELTIELNTQKLKKDNRDAFLYLLERANEDGERENEIKNLKKTDRPIQPDDFNTCMRVAGLSYNMRKEGKKFIIAKKER